MLGEVTRKGPAVGVNSNVVAALLMPPRPSRAVSLKWSDSGLALTPAKPRTGAVGRNSEKQSICVWVGGVDAVGQLPVSALVLLAGICAMSGNTRVGFVVV